MTDPKQSELEARAREWADRVQLLWSEGPSPSSFSNHLAAEVFPIMAAKEEAEREAVELGNAGDRATTEWHEALERERRWREIAEVLARQSKWVANEARAWLGMEREKLVRLLSVTNVRVMEDALKAHGAALAAYEKTKSGESRG